MSIFFIIINVLHSLVCKYTPFQIKNATVENFFIRLSTDAIQMRVSPSLREDYAAQNRAIKKATVIM
jgi:hypothetical protein